MAAPVTLLWFRDDLRVANHEALAAARAAGPVVGLWLREEPDAAGDGPRRLGAASRWWAHRSLEVLSAELDALGIPLLFGRGSGVTVVPAVVAGLGASVVRWTRRYAPSARTADATLKAALAASGVEVHSHPGFLLVEPWLVAPAGGPVYRVFTPFHRAAAEVPVGPLRGRPAAQVLPPAVVDAAARLTATGVVMGLDALDLLDADPPWWADTVGAHWVPGCVAADQALADLPDAIAGYRTRRDRPDDAASTSRLSPRLRFGEVSPRQALAATRSAEVSADDASAWVRQLYWREFSWHLTHHVPRLAWEPLRRQFAEFPWSPDAALLRAWQRGRTGYGLVDAGLRQLWQTGWMHNRVRMVAASFLVKNLLQPWQAGEQWFWDTLVDADEANNPVSWQWVAGCGADAAPYFRVFNPETQRERHDPEGAYVRRWVPEYGTDAYPAPVVDLAESRRRALDAYALLRAR